MKRLVLISFLPLAVAPAPVPGRDLDDRFLLYSEGLREEPLVGGVREELK